MKILAIFSNPSENRLRLEWEAKILNELNIKYSGKHYINPLQAPTLEDVHKILAKEKYDVIHFSGHGSSEGFFLHKDNTYNGPAELASAELIVRIISMNDNNPKLALFMCCYSGVSALELSKMAPFLITTKEEVQDQECIEFVRGFYEWLLENHSIQSSFDHAIEYLKYKKLNTNNIELNRRMRVLKNGTSYVEVESRVNKDTILVDIGGVIEKVKTLGISEEEFNFIISTKLKYHDWIFIHPRENAIIPIGRNLFGCFSWNNMAVGIACKNILKFKEDTPKERWLLWVTMLLAYNDLAASEYRNPNIKANNIILKRNINSYIRKWDRTIETCLDSIGKITNSLFATAQMFNDYVKIAKEKYENGEYDKVVSNLESALTSLHMIVSTVQPEEAVL